MALGFAVGRPDPIPASLASEANRAFVGWIARALVLPSTMRTPKGTLGGVAVPMADHDESLGVSFNASSTMPAMRSMRASRSIGHSSAARVVSLRTARKACSHWTMV